MIDLPWHFMTKHGTSGGSAAPGRDRIAGVRGVAIRGVARCRITWHRVDLHMMVVVESFRWRHRRRTHRSDWGRREVTSYANAVYRRGHKIRSDRWVGAVRIRLVVIICRHLRCFIIWTYVGMKDITQIKYYIKITHKKICNVHQLSYNAFSHWHDRKTLDVLHTN